MRRFVIDTDTGSDDAVALIMALRHPEIVVEAITVVAGNVPVEMGVQNALYTRDLCGSNHVPVYRGAERPLRRPLRTAQFVHGEDGLGDIGLELTGRKAANGSAVKALVEAADRYPGEITLVTLGPLTNVALALDRDPTLVSKIDRCVVMGGTGHGPGNITPVAEFNIWVDPDAAKQVLHSGLPITMVGWDLSVAHAVFDSAQAEAIRALGTDLAAFVVDIQRVLEKFSIQAMGIAGFDLPDPIAMAIAIDPAVATRSARLAVDVETKSPLCQGQTVVDHFGVTEQPANVELVLEASRERFVEMLYAALV